MIGEGEQLDGYTLVRTLGAGGFGTVWLGRGHGREVAIKVLHPNLVHFRGTDKGPSVAERFLAEARILQKLDDPGFVRIHGVIDAPERGVIAYVMEKLTGRDLTKVIRTIALPSLLEVLAQASETLGVLHQHGIIHRDVKGSNIFICDPEAGGGATHHVKLLDFGIAKELHAEAMLESTATGYFLGTVRSMAPECFQRWSEQNPLTGAVDQWSMGITLFYFLTGRMPFDDDSLVRVISQIEGGAPREMRLLSRFGLESCPLDLRRIVDRCMQKDPKDRYPSMDALAAALRGVAARLEPRTDPTVFDPELSKTAVDRDSREARELQEARRLAKALRGVDVGDEAAVDPLGPTAQTPAQLAALDGNATELDRRAAAAEAKAAAAETIGRAPAAAPRSRILDEITRAPKPLAGRLVVTGAAAPADPTLPATSDPADPTVPADTVRSASVEVVGSEPTFIPYATRPSEPALGTGRDATVLRPAPAGRDATRAVSPGETRAVAPAEASVPDRRGPSTAALIGLAVIALALAGFLLSRWL